MEWESVITGILGGGIIVKIYEEIQKTGKITLDESSAKLFYEMVNIQNFISTITLDLQFVNTSQYQKVLKINSVRLYNGEEFIVLIFNNHSTSPASVIKANDVKYFQYDLRLPEKTETPLVSIAYDIAYLEIKYTIGKKSHVAFIQGIKFELIERDIFD